MLQFHWSRSPGVRHIATASLIVLTLVAGFAPFAPFVTFGAAAGGQTQAPGGAQGQPSRDTSAQPTTQQQQQQANATGRISGRVLTADTAAPVRGARISLGSQQANRNMVTDATGRFDFSALPAGRYTLSVSKTGFITLAYGQRRPLQPGTPLQLGDGQRLEGIEMRLPRGSAIEGHVLDENSEPLPNTLVRVMRYQYQQGERRLTVAGSGQTNDKGEYRVWGLNPGEYYVSAVMPNIGSMLDQLGGRIGGPGGAGRGGPNGPPGRGGGPNAPGQGQGGQGGQAPGQQGANGQQAAGRGAQRAAAQAAGAGGIGGLGGLVGGIMQDPNIGDALNAAGLGNMMAMFGSPLDGSADGVAYAPTYYPGVSSPSEAQMVTVGLGAEALNVDFNLLLVRTSTISGRVSNPDGSPVVNGNVNLAPGEGAGGGRGGGPFENFGSRVQNDGTFSIANVPPGRYTLRARSNPGGPGPGGPGGRGGGRGGRGGNVGAAAVDPQADRPLPLFASQSLNVGGGDLTDVLISLAPGATVTGSVQVPPAQAGTQTNMNQVRIMAQAADSSLGTNINGQADQDGRFTLQGVPAGLHWIRATAPRGLALKSVTIGGRDVIDEAYEVRAGETVNNVSIVFTDRVSEINGTVTDIKGLPVTDYTILAFPEDNRLWRPQSRQILTSRPDQNGKFQLRGLPPGRYYLATVDPANNGEWFEPAFLEQHRDTALRVTLMEGEIKTQDFRLR